MICTGPHPGRPLDQVKVWNGQPLTVMNETPPAELCENLEKMLKALANSGSIQPADVIKDMV